VVLRKNRIQPLAFARDYHIQPWLARAKRPTARSFEIENGVPT
jgi:hypothetical protein